jgi:hypothetical protein
MRGSKSARSARVARHKEPKDERMMERRGRSGEFEKRILERKRRSREPEYEGRAASLRRSPAR